jgi:hypothetical protein
VKPTWVILIATLDRRQEKLGRLLDQLLPQAEDFSEYVSVQALWNHGERPVCRVRQDLLDSATANYVSFVDDDDEVSVLYVRCVMNCLASWPDYVGWRMQCFEDGRQLKPTVHSLRYGAWSEDEAGYYRDISHLNPVRRELTRGTSFCADWPEDKAWVDQMRGRLRTEVFIEDVMYFYRFSQTDSVRYPQVEHPSGDWSRPQISSPVFSWHPASSA